VKNKKLFAILTLVCFMFTLMPVAAFAAGDIDAKTMVKVYDAETGNYDTAKATVTVTNEDIVRLCVSAAGGDWYYIAMDSNGKVVELPVVDYRSDALHAEEIRMEVGEVFDVAGTYTIYAVDATDTNVEAVIETSPLLTAQAKADLLLGGTYDNALVKKAATINVKYVADSYNLVVYPVINADMDLGPAIDPATDTIGLAANGSYGARTFAAVLTTANGHEVAGATLKISHNGVNVAKATVTNEDGIGYFQVFGTVVGNFELELSYADVDVEIPVTVGSVAPTEVSVVAEPTAPVDVNEASTAFGAGFKLVDGNGNVLDNDADLLDNYGNKQYKLTVAGPAASTVKASDLSLTWDSTNRYYEIAGIAADSELAEGAYTFTVSLESGKSAAATVNVKEFDEPVALKMMYATRTVDTVAGIGDTVTLKSLRYVDANGVTKDATGDIASDVKLSVSGKAVASFNTGDGTLVVREDDRYIGETITVVAVYDETLIAKADIKVVDEAVTLQYAEGDVQAGTNNTLYFYVKNANGETITLNDDDGVTAASVIVSEKPADAYVAANVTNGLAVSNTALVNFTPSVAGEYELMVIVTYTDTNESGVPVTRSVTGTAVINVGGLDTFKDVVVMSIGADSIVVNSDVKAIPAAPMIKDQRTFVPFRALIEAFGADVVWDEATQSVTAELNGTKVVMTIGSADYTVDGKVMKADVAPFIDGSYTMVPVRFVAQAFGINVTPIAAADGSVADVLFAK